VVTLVDADPELATLKSQLGVPVEGIGFHVVGAVDGAAVAGAQGPEIEVS
jgi:hypothetical protein